MFEGRRDDVGDGAAGDRAAGNAERAEELLEEMLQRALATIQKSRETLQEEPEPEDEIGTADAETTGEKE